MKRTVATRLFGIIAAAALIGGTAACSSDSAPGTDGSGEAGSSKLVLGTALSMATSNVPLAVARHFGFFEEEGLDVEVVVTGDSTASVQGVISGRLDVSSTPPEPVLQVMAASDSASDLVMIYNYVREQTGSLAVLSDSGIGDMADLSGKVIGVSDLGSSNILLTNGSLTTVGLTPEVDFTYLAVGTGAAALQALEAGHVDALALWDTEYAAMEKSGAELDYFTTPEISSLFSVNYFTTRDYFEANADALSAFGRAIAKATYFVALDPEASLRIMYEDYPETLGAGRTVEEQLEVDLTALNARVRLLTAGDPAANGTWGLYEPSAVENWTTFAFESGIIPSQLDPEAIYSNELVSRYNDFDPAAVEALLTD